MQVGDLVRHRFDGAPNEVGIVTHVTARQKLSKAAIVGVMWNHNPMGPHIRDYRMRDLEIVQ